MRAVVSSEPGCADEIVFPACIAAGATVAVIAPSGPVASEPFALGLSRLRARYDVCLLRDVHVRRGYLAGSDAERARELEWALTAPDIAAVFAARGGYGATRIAAAAPWHAFAKAPRWLVGFSDITALHTHSAACNIASIHGPNVTGLGAAGAAEYAALIELLEHESPRQTFAGLTALAPGECAGVLVGGNLSLLAAQAAEGTLAPRASALWFLEDVGERPYRVDRMLTALLPVLRSAAGVVFGSFEECVAGPDGTSIAEVLGDFATRCGVPVWAGLPSGHGACNAPLLLGGSATIAGGVLVIARR